MLLSVIIPVFNSEVYLEKCIKSILYEDKIEIIIVDDGSNDNSINIIKYYSDNYDSVTYISQKNSGQGKARNKGLNICTGKYVTFVDSDDYISSGEELYKLAKRADIQRLDMLVYNYNVIKDNIIMNKDLNFEDKLIYSSNDILKLFLTTNKVEGFSCNKLFRNEIINKFNIRFLEEQKYEDIPMVVNSILNCNRIGFSNTRVYNYIIHNNSTTQNININTLQDEIKSIDIILQNILNSKNDDNIKNYIYRYVRYRVCLYTVYRIKNLIRKKISYNEFKTIINEYIKLNRKYLTDESEMSDLGLNRKYILSFKFINILYGRKL